MLESKVCVGGGRANKAEPWEGERGSQGETLSCREMSVFETVLGRDGVYTLSAWLSPPAPTILISVL